jgi:heme-degrading monooxygenase HmoA
MIKIVEMDEKVTLSDQMEEKNVGAVILINKFTMNQEDVDQFLKTWASAAEIAKKLPGVISLQLHRGIAGSRIFVAYVVFESTETIKQLYNSPDFQSKISEYPASTVISPHIFKKVAVPAICVD